MEQTVNWEKVYVDTLVRHTKDGGSIPLSIKFSDGKTYEMAGVSTDDTKKMTLNDNVAIVVKGDFCLYLDDANAEAKDIGLLTELYIITPLFKSLYANPLAESVSSYSLKIP